MFSYCIAHDYNISIEDMSYGQLNELIETCRKHLSQIEELKRNGYYRLNHVCKFVTIMTKTSEDLDRVLTDYETMLRLAKETLEKL